MHMFFTRTLLVLLPPLLALSLNAQSLQSNSNNELIQGNDYLASNALEDRITGNQGKNRVEPPTWKTSQIGAYSLEHPADWTLQQPGQMGTLFTLLSPLESPDDAFHENLNAIEQDLKGMGITLDAYIELTEQQIQTYITKPSVLVSRRVKKGKNEYHQLVYTGIQGKYSLRFEQYVWLLNEKAVVLTFTGEKSKAEQYAALATRILGSFTLP
ncbi:MAG: hypothetical protein FJZ75_08205 [Bacteroidetes bacterium]|nr:hypothetical protein [Bacteroidota bacterium]